MSIFPALAVIDSLLDIGHRGYNFIKDINNTDTERAVDAQQELMGTQDEYNQLAFNRSANFTREMYGRQMVDTWNLLRDQENFNRESERLQYAREGYLNSPTRLAYLMRQAGIQPGQTGSGGSITAFGAPSSSPPSASSPSPQSVSGGSVSSSHYNSGGSSLSKMLDIENQKSLQEKELKFKQDMEKSLIDARERDTNATAQGKEIDNIFKYEQHVLQLQETIMRIDNLEREGKKVTAEEESIRETYKAQIQYWNDQIAVMKRNAAVAERNASTNERNATVAEVSLEEQKKQNKIHNGFTKALISLQERGLIIQESKMQPEIDKLQADTRKTLADAELSEKQIPMIEEKVRSEIKKNEKLSEYLHQQALKTGKDVQYYEIQMAKEIATSIVHSAAEVVTAGAKVIDAAVPL